MMQQAREVVQTRVFLDKSAFQMMLEERDFKTKCLDHCLMMMTYVGKVVLLFYVLFEKHCLLFSNTGSNPSKKARNEVKIIEDPPQSDIQDEPSKYLAPRPKRYVFRLVPPEPHLGITTYTGQKLFIRLKSEESLMQKVSYIFRRFIHTAFYVILCSVGHPP